MKETHRLDRMLNKTFIYKQDQIVIRDYFQEPEKGTVRVITDKKPITVQTSQLADFEKACLPVEEPATQAVSTEVVSQASSLLLTLQQTLLDNIEMVKKDKEYTKQANVVNSSVNALIGMAKLQLQVGKLNKK